MSLTLAVVGALGSATLCGIAGVVGAKAAFRQAANPAERQILRQVFGWGGAYVSAVMGLVLLIAFQFLPQWSYVLAVLLWFGPMVPALNWVHHQLKSAVGQQAHSNASLSAA